MFLRLLMPQHLHDTERQNETAIRAIADYLKNNQSFGGLVASYEPFAIKALQAINENGLPVPKAVLVITFENRPKIHYPRSALMSALTTVTSPFSGLFKSYLDSSP